MNQNDYIEISLDNDPPIVYESPHFVKTYPQGCSEPGQVVTQLPVAYVSGKKPTVQATFLTDCVHSYYIRGLANNGMVFDKQLLTPQDGEIVYQYKESDLSFEEGVVKYFENFSIQWQASEDGASNWLNIEQSSNPVYVLKSLPSPGLFSTPPFQYTIVHTSCSAAGGQSDDAIIIEKVYDKFETKSVERVSDDYTMTYWDAGAPNNGQCWNVEDLLLNGNGQCGAWSEFFYACMAIQDITVQEITVSKEISSEMEKDEIEDHVSNSIYGPDFNIEMYDLFAVKNWNTSEEFIFLGEGQFTLPILNGDGGGLPGVVGQGGNEPRSLFDNHVIIKLNNDEFLDPSYGTNSNLTTTNIDWEDESIDVVHGVVFADKFDDTGQPIIPPRYYLYLRKLNTENSLDLIYTPN